MPHIICTGKDCPICKVFGKPSPIRFGLMFGSDKSKIKVPIGLTFEKAKQILDSYKGTFNANNRTTTGSI